jgi:hypothetical protein
MATLTGFAALDEDAELASVVLAAPRVLRNDFGNSITTTLTDAEAVAVVESMPPDHRDAKLGRRLASEWRTYGSEKLFEWKLFKLHSIVAYWRQERDRRAEAERFRQEAEERAKYGNEPSNFDATAASRMERIADFLTAGATRLYGSGAVTGARVTFESGPFLVSIHSTARDKTRWPGGFLVTGCTGFGAPNTPLARIDANGYLYFADAGRLCPELHALLEAFNEEPATFVSRMGLNSARCVFCRLPLSDPISMTLGYGAICAGHYNLPYGKDAMQAARMRCQKPADGGVENVPLP